MPRILSFDEQLSLHFANFEAKISFFTPIFSSSHVSLLADDTIMSE